MAASDIRIELNKLIEQEQDISILQAIKTLLSKHHLEGALKNKLTARALNAEQNIIEGTVLSPKEMKARTDQFLSE